MMNTYKKYAPNVWVAKCTEQHVKGETITLTTKRGRENEHIVHNFLGTLDDHYLYSITRADGFNSQERAKRKVERLEGWAANAQKRGEDWQEKSNEGRDFLALGEPIKIGHHSEKRHRALIERNWRRMENAMEEYKKAEDYESRVAYWESMAKKINLSMPESLSFYADQLEEATAQHKGLKDGTIERVHSYSLTYAKKRVNELTKKLKLAVLLWGDNLDEEE